MDVRCIELLEAEEQCPLCQQEAPDKWHCFWTCPALGQSEEEAIISTQKFIPDLKYEHEHYYNRLILTEGMLQLDEAFNPIKESPIFTTSPHPEGVPE